MFENILLKTLYEKRWMTLWWSVAGFALIVLIMTFFPVMKESLGESLKDVPESMRAVLGDAAAWQTIKGYVELQVFEQMVFLPVILGIILGTSLLAGKESEGTLQTLLSHPVSRGKVYVQSLLANLAITALVSAIALWGGVLAGAALIGEDIDAGGVLGAAIMAWLVSVLFSMFGYSLGAATGRRGLAAALAGGLAFATFMVTSLVAGIDSLRYAEYLSPFHYYDAAAALGGTFPWGHAALLVGASIALAIAGYLRFKTRDIYPH